jgi:hypothetical protein
MTGRGVILGICALLALSACGRLFGQGEGTGEASFGGLKFDAKLTASADDRRAFTVVVREAARNIEAAQEAGRYEAVAYCLYNFGASDMEWTAGPDLPADQVVLEDGALTMSGRCTAR